jgi:ANTAR domain
MPTQEQQLADFFVAVAGSVTDDCFDVPRILSVLADRSPAMLGARAATVVFFPEEHEPPLVAGSEPEACQLERDAVGWGEGPGHDCRRSAAPPTATALAGWVTRQRWPHYAPRAQELGYTHAAALPLRGQDQVPGAFVLLSDRDRPPGTEALMLGQSLADFAAVLLQRAREAHRSRLLTAQLDHALTSRVLVEQAKGVLAARLSVSMDEAFARMRRHARSHRRPLRDVAREVIENRADPELRAP